MEGAAALGPPGAAVAVAVPRGARPQGPRWRAAVVGSRWWMICIGVEKRDPPARRIHGWGGGGGEGHCANPAAARPVGNRSPKTLEIVVREQFWSLQPLKPKMAPFGRRHF